MKYTIEVQWAITVGAYLEVEAENPEDAIKRAKQLVADDAAVAEDLAVQAHECVRDGGAYGVSPQEAVGVMVYAIDDAGEDYRWLAVGDDGIGEE